jgi:hypothetical protein
LLLTSPFLAISRLHDYAFAITLSRIEAELASWLRHCAAIRRFSPRPLAADMPCQAFSPFSAFASGACAAMLTLLRHAATLLHSGYAAALRFLRRCGRRAIFD